jgi:hypothetical protein
MSNEILSKRDQENRELMEQWDAYRAMLLAGDTGSLPRDWFASVVDGFQAEIAELKEEALTNSVVIAECALLLNLPEGTKSREIPPAVDKLFALAHKEKPKAVIPVVECPCPNLEVENDEDGSGWCKGNCHKAPE